MVFFDWIMNCSDEFGAILLWSLRVSWPLTFEWYMVRLVVAHKLLRRKTKQTSVTMRFGLCVQHMSTILGSTIHIHSPCHNHPDFHAQEHVALKGSGLYVITKILDRIATISEAYGQLRGLM